MSKKSKIQVETIEQFLARGGEIKRYPMVRPEELPHTLSVTPMSLHEMSLSEGEHFFGEGRNSKSTEAVKPKKMPSVDLSKIPDHIRAKLKLVALED